MILGEKLTKKIVLPSSLFSGTENWVEINLSIPAKELLANTSDIQGRPEIDISNESLAKMIVDWNFTDAEGKKAPITLENVSMLPGIDTTKINIEISKLANTDAEVDAKKNPSSVTSSPENNHQ